MPRPLFPLEKLLAKELEAYGITYGVRPVVTAPVPVRELWDAFCAFSKVPVNGLVPGVKTPGPELDTLAFEPAPATAARPNIPARPPGLYLARRVWLVDANDELVEEASAHLEFVLNDESAETVSSEPALYGSGGPDGGDARTRWLHAVEQSAFGRCLATPEIVVRVLSN